jgi:DivIVA domain-containing protein
MRKKQNEAASQGFAPDEAAPSTASRMIAPLDIQQKEFRVARFGGYKMRDVDEFLDQVTDAMTAVIAENERMRKGASPGAAPVVGNSDLADVNRQADEMIQRARAEAARIVAEAREQAAALSGAGAAIAGSDAGRAAVSAFLAREKEFLQSLAGLVQGHAEQVKTMAKSARMAAPRPAAQVGEPPASRPADEPATEEPVRTAALPEATPAPEAEGSDVPEVSVSAEEPVHVEEPEPARAGRSDAEDPSAADDSLRELFWGED